MAEADLGCYVYCVVRAGERPSLEGVHGVDPEFGPELLTHGELGALVSPVRLDEFGEEALKRNLEDLGWLERTARAHDAVLARALDSAAVVPMRLCTIFTDEEHARGMLDRERDALTGALERLSGRAEWGVKILADLQALEAAARERAPALAGTAEEESPGRAFFARKKADQTVQEEARALAQEAAEESHARLRQEASAATLLRLQSRELSGRSGEMILNGAYLVDRSRGDSFEAVVGELAARHRDIGFTFELSGPWAPYNFVSIEEERSGER